MIVLCVFDEKKANYKHISLVICKLMQRRLFDRKISLGRKRYELIFNHL